MSAPSNQASQRIAGETVIDVTPPELLKLEELHHSMDAIHMNSDSNYADSLLPNILEELRGT